MDANPHPISIDRLAGSVAAPGAPLLLDERPAAAFRAEPVLIPGARWRDPAAIERWLYELPRRPLVVYDARGRDPTPEIAGKLCAAERDAAYLEGGLAAWRAAGCAMVRGLSTLFADDHDILGHGLVLYDALYAQLRAAEHEGRRPRRPRKRARRRACPSAISPPTSSSSA